VASTAGRPLRRSVVYTGLILFGILLAVAGAVIAVLGIGKPSATEVSGGGVDVKTSSVGLVILVVGAGLAGILALKKPGDIELFTDRPARRPLPERIAGNAAIPALAIAAVGVVLLVVSLVIG
jgi:uncharacterized membrane protein YidH (DUF202 family)